MGVPAVLAHQPVTVLRRGFQLGTRTVEDFQKSDGHRGRDGCVRQQVVLRLSGALFGPPLYVDCAFTFLRT